MRASSIPAVPDSENFAPSDDGLHEPGDEFYFNETYWFSFFAPERGLGGWLYSGNPTQRRSDRGRLLDLGP